MLVKLFRFIDLNYFKYYYYELINCSFHVLLLAETKVDDLRSELKTALRQYPGASLVVNAESTAEGGDPIEIEISGSDMDELRRISGEVQLALR